MDSLPEDDPRRERLAEICRALPEAMAEPAGRHATFRVRKRTFAYYLDDHHGDGIVGLNCKVSRGENEALVAAAPDRFYMPAYLGPRGWIGYRLDAGTTDWTEVAELVTDSYLLIAPKRLAAVVEERIGPGP
jgi:predicted DNA-binding protein (MmcQ/YjbR family)